MIIYTNPTCVRCKMLKQLLRTKNINYEEINVEELNENDLNDLQKFSSSLPIVKDEKGYISFEDMLKNLK